MLDVLSGIWKRTASGRAGCLQPAAKGEGSGMRRLEGKPPCREGYYGRLRSGTSWMAVTASRGDRSIPPMPQSLKPAYRAISVTSGSSPS